MNATINIHHSQTTYFKNDKQFLTEAETIKFNGEPVIKLQGHKKIKEFFFTHQDNVEENFVTLFFKSHDGFELIVVDDKRKS